MFQGNTDNPFASLGSTSSSDLIDKYKNDSAGESSPFDSLTPTEGGSSLLGGDKKQANPFDALSSGGENSFDQTFSINKKELGEEHTSIFQQKGAFMQEGNVAHDLNIRAQRYGQLSVVDKMRGIQANRLNIEDDNVSLAESYADGTLDKRVMNGQYNTTITDLYKDRSKFEAYHGLITDGKIEEKENAMIDSEIGLDNKNNFSGTLIGGYKTVEEQKEEEKDPYDVLNSSNKNIPISETLISGYKTVEEQKEEEEEEKNTLMEQLSSQSVFYKKDQPEEQKKDKIKKKDNKFKESITAGNNTLSTSMYLNKEEEEDEEKGTIKEYFKQTAKNTFGEDDEDFTKKIASSRSGTKGIYGEQSMEKKEDDISSKIREIIKRMSIEKLQEVITKYSLMPEKTHKDKLKLSIAQEIAQKKREKGEFL